MELLTAFGDVGFKGLCCIRPSVAKLHFPRTRGVFACLAVSLFALPALADDVLTQQAFLTSGNGFVGYFGSSVAVSSDTLVVGAPNESGGAAYVFVRNGSTWTQQARLRASLTFQFGCSVAISGDTIVVGDYAESSDATGVNGSQNRDAIQSGAAYVFVRNGSTWSQQAYLKASNSRGPDSEFGGAFGGGNFGISVAVSGDTIVVGAKGEDSNATGVNGNQLNIVPAFGLRSGSINSGAAYVFVRSGITWTQQAYLKASNTGGGDAFGSYVAVSGDTVVVAAPGEDSNATGVNGDQTNNGAIDSGAAYVFVRSGNEWSQQAYLKASNTGFDDTFGTSVAVSGDTIIVGALGEDSNATGVNGDQTNNGARNSGAAYIFTRSGGRWSQQAYLKASKTQADDRFGFAVAVSGDTALVGVTGEDINTTGVNGSQDSNSGFAFDSGAVYVFMRTGGGWSQRAYLKASNTRTNDQFGSSVAAFGDTLAVGAYGRFDGTGAAYVFLSPPSTLPPPPPSKSTFTLSQTAISFLYQFGAAGPIEPQTLRVTSSPGEIAFGAAAVTDSAGNWLSVTPLSGTTPGSLVVSVTPGLAPGTYVGQIEVSSAEASNSPLKVSVTYTVLNVTVTEGPRTVFLVHGIAQDGGEDGNLSRLASTLRTLLDPKRFVVDAGFDFRYCAKPPFVELIGVPLAPLACDAACTIGGLENTSFTTNGARALGAHIDIRKPPGPIILVGYSMGGLIARDMILNGFTKYPVAGLITLGTPHLGYPYESEIDDYLRCKPLAKQMFGDFRKLPSSDEQKLFTDGVGNAVTLSDYLFKLNSDWAAADPSRLPKLWYTAAGTSCDNSVRQRSDKGCKADTRNDGIVCRQSASLDFRIVNPPRERWEDPSHRYSHTDGRLSVFCQDTSFNPLFPLGSPPPYPLWAPDSDPDGELIFKLSDWITGLP